MASMKTYRIVTLSTSTPYSFVTGTTGLSTSPPDPSDKGVEVTFQNQSTAAVNIWIGPTGFVPSIGSTSTLGAGGIILAQNGTYSVGKRHAPSAIQMLDWFVASTSSNAICHAMLVKAV